MIDCQAKEIILAQDQYILMYERSERSNVPTVIAS
jgi:hypothetical protein